MPTYSAVAYKGGHKLSPADGVSDIGKLLSNFDLLLGCAVPQRTLIVDPSGGPYTTLGAAKAAAMPGDHIRVRPGLYAERNLCRSFKTSIISAARDGETGLVTVAATAHGLSVGDEVVIGGLTGTTEFNGRWRVVTVTDADTFAYMQPLDTDTAGGSGFILRPLHYHFEPGATVVFDSEGATADPGAIFDDVTAGGAAWLEVSGDGGFVTIDTSWNENGSLYPVIALSQPHSRMTIQCRTIHHEGAQAAVYTNAATGWLTLHATESIRSTGYDALWFAQVENAFVRAPLIESNDNCIESYHSGMVEVIVGLMRHISDDPSTADLMGGLINISKSAAAEGSPNGTTIIRVGRMESYSPLLRIGEGPGGGVAKCFLDAGEMIYHGAQKMVQQTTTAASIRIRCPRIKCTNANAYFMATGATGGKFYFDDATLIVGASATNSIATSAAINLYVVGRLTTNKALHGDITVLGGGTIIVNTDIDNA